MSKEKVNVLVLEDSEERLKRFRAFFGDHNNYVFDVDYTKDVDEALALMDTKTYDLVFLDHDLDGAHYAGQPSTKKTGHDFAKALSGHPKAERIVLAVVMSANPVGAENMMNALQFADVTRCRMPFAWTKLDQVMGIYKKMKCYAAVEVR